MTKHTGKVIPASTFEYLLWNTLYTHVRAHTNTRSYNRDVFVLARERAFELRINASHRLGGLKGLRESLWTEPKIILRVHAAEWTGIRCLRCPGNEATPRLGFAHLFLSFFFPLPSRTLGCAIGRSCENLCRRFTFGDFPFLFSSPLFYYFLHPLPSFYLLSRNSPRGILKREGEGIGGNVCQHFAARRATNWRVTGNEVSKGLNTLSLGRARVAERQI